MNTNVCTDTKKTLHVVVNKAPNLDVCLMIICDDVQQLGRLKIGPVFVLPSNYEVPLTCTT